MKTLTEKEALKILASEEKRFKDAGFGRGAVLAKSAHDYHKAILEWRKKTDACAEDYNAAKKRLDAFTAELKRKEAQARKLLDDLRFGGGDVVDKFAVFEVLLPVGDSADECRRLAVLRDKDCTVRLGGAFEAGGEIVTALGE